MIYHFSVFLFFCFFLVGCGGIKKGIPKITKDTHPFSSSSKNNDLDYEEYIKTIPSNLPYSERVKAYVMRYKVISKEEMRKYKIPASITLAQGILESGAGKGELALRSNNHFGIKCHKEWEGKSVKHDDDTKAECFRKYKNPEQSFEDHSVFLASRKRYLSLFKLSQDDYRGWAIGLKKAGYATDPKYPQKLIRIIETYHLDQYDRQVLKKEKKHYRKNKSTETSEKYHLIQRGDTLYSLSKRYNTSVSHLKKLNKMTNNILSIGQRLRIK